MQRCGRVNNPNNSAFAPHRPTHPQACTPTYPEHAAYDHDITRSAPARSREHHRHHARVLRLCCLQHARCADLRPTLLSVFRSGDRHDPRLFRPLPSATSRGRSATLSLVISAIATVGASCSSRRVFLMGSQRLSWGCCRRTQPRELQVRCCWYCCDSCRERRWGVNGLVPCCCRWSMGLRTNAGATDRGHRWGHRWALLATGAIAALTLLLTPEDFLAWGWRLPFFASVILVGFGLWIRAGVAETPPFLQLAGEGSKAKAPIAEVFRVHWRSLVRGGGARVGPDVLYSLTAIFSLSYLTTALGQSRPMALIALSIGGACNAIAIPLFGGLSDRYGRRAVYGAGVAAALIWIFALFPMLETRAPGFIVAAISAGLIIHACMYGPQAAFIAEQFPARVRYAGSSLAYTLAGIVGGGIAPVMFASLLRIYETYWAVVAYTAVALLVTGFVLLISRRQP